MSSKRAGLAGHALLQAAVTAQNKRVVVHDTLEVGRVEHGGQVLLRHRHTHSIRETLSQGTSGHLHAGSQHVLWVARSAGAQLAELLQVVQGQVIASQMQHGVQQCARMSIGKHKAISVGPLGVLGRVVHHLGEQNVCDRGAAHRSTRVTGVRLLHHIGREHTDGINASIDQGHDFGLELTRRMQALKFCTKNSNGSPNVRAGSWEQKTSMAQYVNWKHRN